MAKETQTILLRVVKGRDPRTRVSGFLAEGNERLQLNPVDEERFRDQVQQVVQPRRDLQRGGLERVRRPRLQRASRGKVPQFAMREHVLVMRFHQKGRNLKLMRK